MSAAEPKEWRFTKTLDNWTSGEANSCEHLDGSALAGALPSEEALPYELIVERGPAINRLINR